MKYLGMAIHSLGVFLAGAWIISIAINAIWPESKIINNKEDQSLNINIKPLYDN